MQSEKVLEASAKSDPISLDISPANGGMSGNQGGWDEGQAPEGQTRRHRTDARSDRGRPAGALERTAEDGVGFAVTERRGLGCCVAGEPSAGARAEALE